MDQASIKTLDDDALIRRWRSSRDLQSYNELRSRHSGLIFKQVNTYASSGVPRPALEAEANKLFDDAVNNYKPTSAASFSTFLVYYLKRLDRYNRKNQDTARIPEALSLRIGEHDRVRNQLAEELMREPTPQEIAKQMGMSKSRVMQLQNSRRQDLYEGGFEGQTTNHSLRAANMHALHDLGEELTGQEKEVYEYLTGLNGKPKITNKIALAKKLGMSPGRISQITSSISKKLQPKVNRRLR